MEFTMRINMDEMEEGNRDRDLARILVEVSDAVRDGVTSDICVSFRGTTVGGWQINED